MAATAPQPEQDLQIYGADFKGASGTIRTSEVGPPDTPANSHAGTAGPADSAVRKAESDPAVPPPLTSKDAPQSPSNAGQQQQQARTPQNSRPQVSVVYKRLPQKCKDQLEEALIGWAAWHAAAYGNDPDDSQDSLVLNITPVRHQCINTEDQAGRACPPSFDPCQTCKLCPADHQFEGCQPAEQVQQEPRCSGRLRFEPLALSAAEDVDANVAAASAWVDVPEAGEEQQQLVGKATFNLAYEKGGSVPQYDRGVLTPLGQGAGNIGHQDGAVPSPAPRPTRAPQRCFNCGSYSHGLRDCWQPRNAAAVTAARAEFTAASGDGTIMGQKLPSRYFTSMTGAGDEPSEGGDGTSWPAADGTPAPGQLSAELRAALGILPSAPPPWLARMRRLGYPPGYVMADSGAAVDAGDADAVQLVFGDDAPAELHAAWAAVEPCAAAGASAAVTGATGGTALASASGADADAGAGASAAAASGKAPDEAATGAQAALVARLVAALSGAVFDCGDARGVALSGSPQGVHLPEARLESDLVTALTASMPIDKAAQLAAAALQANAGSSGGSALTRRQIKRALLMASKRQAAFPGLNAPLPDGADIAAWSASEHESKAGQSQQKRQALAGSKRAHPEPQLTGAAMPDGRAAAGMLSPSHGQQHKRQALGGSPAGTAAGPMRLMNGQHAPPQPTWQVPGWPDAQQQSVFPHPVPQLMHTPPPRHRHQGTQQLLPLQAYSSGYAPQSTQGPGGAAAPQSAGLMSTAPGVQQQRQHQQQQQQQSVQAQPSWVQHPPLSPPPPPPSPPMPQQPQPAQPSFMPPPTQQALRPSVQPPGGQQAAPHEAVHHSGPPVPQYAQPPPQRQEPQQQQQQQRAVQTLPDWQPMQHQAAPPGSNAWQQTYLTPAAQQAWSPVQQQPSTQQRQPSTQLLQYQQQQPPLSQHWQQRYTPQTASASTGGWQQQQQLQQQYLPPQPPLPAPVSGGWPDQQQAPLPPMQQPSQQQNVAHGQMQSLQQQPQRQWQQAAWQ